MAFFRIPGSRIHFVEIGERWRTSTTKFIVFLVTCSHSIARLIQVQLALPLKPECGTARPHIDRNGTTTAILAHKRSQQMHIWIVPIITGIRRETGSPTRERGF